MIRRLLCTLHSAAWAWERWTPDETINVQPAEEERAELVERIAAQRRRIAELEDELSRVRDGYVPEEMHEELRQSLLAVSRDLARASYWKRGEPGEPRRLVVQWHPARSEPVHALSTHHYGAHLEGWYAEALGEPPSEEEQP